MELGLIRFSVLPLALGLAVPIQLAAQSTRYIHTDALGSVVAITDVSGAIVNGPRDYEPYGRQVNSVVQDGPGYVGHVRDAVTGLTYMQQRYYDPDIGRFLGADPVAPYDDPVGMFNRYQYAKNNPYRFYDPDGRREREVERMDFRSMSSHPGLGGVATSGIPDAGFFARGIQTHNRNSNPTGGRIRGCDTYGCGHDGATRGTRRHNGADYVTTPGSDVRAPMGGVVVRQSDPYAGDSRYSGLLIKSDDGTITQVWYVRPEEGVIGERVYSGKVVGVSQDLGVRYPTGMTNHVHVRITNSRGENIDPADVLPDGAMSIK